MYSSFSFLPLSSTSLLAGRILDIAIHVNAALLDLLALGAQEVLDRTELAVLCDFLEVSAPSNTKQSTPKRKDILLPCVTRTTAGPAP
jgi:hypothetical protein